MVRIHFPPPVSLVRTGLPQIARPLRRNGQRSVARTYNVSQATISRAGFEVEPTPPGRAPPRKMNRLRPKSAMRGLKRGRELEWHREHGWCPVSAGRR
jgi:hypothetical protein